MFVSRPDATSAVTVRMGFVVDVVGYSARSAGEKIDLQHRVSTLVVEMLRDLGLDLDDTFHHGTGDGMVVFLPTEVEVHRALARLLRSATEALAEDNRRYRDRMRLRMAFVVGPLGPAAIGFSGSTIVEAGRMVDSDVLRAALTERPGVDLVVLVSDQLHAYVVRERHTGLEHDDFVPVQVRAKEFQARAWLWSRPGAVGPGPEPATPPYELAPPAGSACQLGIVAGRIMRARGIDIWVNSENTDMEMARHNDFSVSSIIRYHGSRRDASGRVVADVVAEELAAVTGDRRPVAPGSAFVTSAGALTETNDVRWIIHVAAVFGEPGAGFRQVRNVGACVGNALVQADRLADTDDSVRTILFPLLGAGGAGGSTEATAREMVDAAADYLIGHPHTRLRLISLLAYTEAERVTLVQTLARHRALRPVGPVH